MHGVLDQPITARIDLHSPSLGNTMMMVDDTRTVVTPEQSAPIPVATPPPDPLLAAVTALHAEIVGLRADLESRTWLARFRRLWHRLSSWAQRIR